MREGFAERWRDKRRACGLDPTDSELVEFDGWVLPGVAAPCLTFERAAKPVPIWEVYASPSDWSAQDRARLAPYRMIGSDGAGNPICVEEGSGTIYVLDHEDWFQTRLFVNSGVRQLTECLLAYLGEQDPERFRSAVREIDPPAIAEGTFWWCEAAGLESP